MELGGDRRSRATTGELSGGRRSGSALFFPPLRTERRGGNQATQPPPVLDPHLFHPSIFVLLDGVGRNGSAGSEECWRTGSHWNGSIVVADSVGVRHWADFGVFNPADSGVSCTSSSSGLNPTLSSSSLPRLDFFVLLSNKSWSSSDRVVAVGVTVSESVSATVSILLL
nr:hypothetical protein Iba_chr04dCG13670 [Ipomoea batatas]